jgi:hypothetical protein
MTKQISQETLEKLNGAQNIWFSSVRPDGRPHLTPVWFIWHEEKFYVGIDPHSIKSRNIHHNPRVVLALEDGTTPVICEGIARLADLPLSESLLKAFRDKYEWDLLKEEQYNQVIEITPLKWLGSV